MNDIAQMKLLVAAVEAGSFARAAETLGISNGTASRQIKALEERLGVRLFQRTTRQVEITADGAACYKKCLEVLAAFDELEDMFLNEPHKISGPIRAGMTHHTAQVIIIPRLPEFVRRYPEIRIELVCHDLLSNPLSDGLDCMLHVHGLQDGNYIAKPLYRLLKANCASPEYLAAYGMPKHLGELTQHRLIHFKRDPEGFECRYDDKLNHLHMPTALRVNSLDALTAAAVAGIGIAQSFRYLVQPFIDRGELVEILPDYPSDPLPGSLLYPHKLPPQRVRVFMRWLEEVIADFIADNPRVIAKS